MISRGRGAALLGLLLVLIAPSTAHAYSSGSFFADDRAAGAYGHESFYDPVDSRFELRGDAHEVSVSVDKPSGSEHAGIRLTAPEGEVLQGGRSYPNAISGPYLPPGVPGLDLTDHFGCNSHGNFEILDLATGPDGKVTRLRATWERHCNENPPGTYGEIDVGAPAPDPARASPSRLRWPVRELASPDVPRPITVRVGSAPVTFTGSQITGTDASSFAVTSDGCAGRTIGPGGSCVVRTTFKPAQSGERNARLSVLRSGGAAATTDLAGFAYGGVTDLTVTVNRHDKGFADQHFTAADGEFFADSPREYVNYQDMSALAVNQAHDNPFLVQLAPPEGQRLVLGRKYEITKGAPNQPLFLVTSQAGLCRDFYPLWFRVNEQRLGPDGLVRATDVEFAEYCQSDPSVVFTGRFSRRAGDTTPLASWLTGGSLQAPFDDAGPGTSTTSSGGSAGTALTSASNTRALPTAPRMTLISTRYGVSKNGTFTLGWSIPAGSPPATVAVQITSGQPAAGRAHAAIAKRVTLARGRMRMKGGGRAKLRLKLSPAGRKLLAKRGTLKVRVEGTVSGSGLATRRVNTTATLRLPK